MDLVLICLAMYSLLLLLVTLSISVAKHGSGFNLSGDVLIIIVISYSEYL